MYVGLSCTFLSMNFVASLAAIPLASGMPSMDSRSQPISAACHNQQERGIEFKGLRYGVIPRSRLDDGRKHVGFSSKAVESLVDSKG